MRHVAANYYELCVLSLQINLLNNELLGQICVKFTKIMLPLHYKPPYRFCITCKDKSRKMLSQKISYNEVAEAKRMFDACKSVVIVTHVSPDGDAIGSSLGLYEYLKKKGKMVTVIVPNYFPDFLRWMKDRDKIIQFDIHRAKARTYVEHADLIAVLDLNEPKRLDELSTLITSSKAKKIMIDHHLQPQKNFCDLIISYPNACSTSELIFRLIDAIGGMSQLTKAAAEDIYTGMCTDTGKFTFNSNDPDIFLILAELLKKGIDKDKINRLIYNNYSEARFRLLGYILSEKLQVFQDVHTTLFTLNREEMKRFKYLKGDTEGVVNMPLQIKGTKLSIYMREDTEKPRIFVSLRSVDDFPANKVAADFFNGGGHLNAAGGQMQCTMEEAVEVVHKALEAYRDLLTEGDPVPNKPATKADQTADSNTSESKTTGSASATADYDAEKEKNGNQQ